jgi:hypothetical protein
VNETNSLSQNTRKFRISKRYFISIVYSELQQLGLEWFFSNNHQGASPKWNAGWVKYPWMIIMMWKLHRE